MNEPNFKWGKTTLSDANTIKGLLKFRHQFKPTSEDAICIYADLDKLIDKAKFNDYQKKILNLYEYGYSEEDISDVLEVEKQSINSVVDTICNTLCELNYQDWKLNYIFWNKCKVRTNYKRCSKCEEYLPATEEYFYKELMGKDGYKQKCIKCSKNM